MGRSLDERRPAVKRAEERLRENERRLNDLFDRLALALRIARTGRWDRDLQTGEVRWSAETCRMTLMRFCACRNLPPVMAASATTNSSRMPMIAYFLRNPAASKARVTWG